MLKLSREIEVDEGTGEAAGVLRIAATPTIGNYILPSLYRLPFQVRGREDLAQGRLRAIGTRALKLTRNFSIITHRDVYHGGLQAAFTNFVRASTQSRQGLA